MNVFIWIYDDSKKFLTLQYPQELARFFEEKKTKEGNNYYVQFFKLKDGKMKREYSSVKNAPEFNPIKDRLFLYVDAFWEGNEKFQLEQMRGIATVLERSNAKYGVKLISFYGDRKKLADIVQVFKGVFGEKVYDYVESYYGYKSPGMRADFAAQESKEILDIIELTKIERLKKYLPKDVKEDMHGMRQTWPNFS